jgi:nicotinate-nucleotide adenylyltransferase
LGIFRLGVLGGTFNPIHSGHLHIARYVQKVFSLSKILFVVAADPPHKPQKSLISFAHRYAMVSLATSGEPRFTPSLVELESHASSYSVDTMRKISRSIRSEEGEIYFIAGGDSLLEVNSWKESEKLLTSHNFIFVLRPGAKTGNYRDFLPEKAVSRVCDLTGLSKAGIRRQLEEKQFKKNRLFIVDGDAPNISATRIRNLAAAGKNFRSLVPMPVYSYIQKLRLYGER